MAEGERNYRLIEKPTRITAAGNKPKLIDEYTLVLRVEHRGGALDVRAAQAVVVRRGEWVRYSTPGEDVAVCLPAFSPQAVHRDST
jgi:hypothetical protein